MVNANPLPQSALRFPQSVIRLQFIPITSGLFLSMPDASRGPRPSTTDFADSTDKQQAILSYPRHPRDMQFFQRMQHGFRRVYKRRPATYG
jgi:hypothetical protein